MIELLKKMGFTFAGFYGAAYALKSASVKLDYFTAKEFGAWWPIIDSRLLIALDQFRAALGAPVVISPAAGSIGRVGSDAKHSQHFALNGVTAIDVLIPENISLEHAYHVARSLGVFTGLGVYPHWSPRHGLHLDVRSDKTPEAPALWSGLKVDGVQVYRSIEEGFA